MACALIVQEYGGVGRSGTPDTTVESSGGVADLIQLNIDEGGVPVRKLRQLCCCIMLLRFYGWAAMLLCFSEQN